MKPSPRAVTVSALSGLLMAACGALAFIVSLDEPMAARRVAGFMILAGGGAEAVVGLFGIDVERSPTDISLGLVSLAAASILLLVGEVSALSFTALLAVWLLARGATELVGGVVVSSENARVAAFRLARGWTDLVLAAATLIAALATAFPAFLLGWPSSIARMVLLFVAISLLTSAGLHIGLAFAFGRAARSRRP
jgi:uncharacterized membrane protein HdeD (DUF308 family)